MILPSSSISTSSREMDVARGYADLDRVGAALHMPVVEPLRPVGEGAVVQRDGDVLRLAGFERDLGEALKLVHRACDLGLRRGHVDLHGFGAGHIGGVGHGHSHLAVRGPVLATVASCTSNVA